MNESINYSIIVRTSKPETKIRFRLSSKGVHVYHKTDIVAPIRELQDKYNCTGKGGNFTCDGEKKKGVVFYDIELYNEIQTEKGYIKEALKEITNKGLSFDSETVERLIEEYKHPEKALRRKQQPLIDAFDAYIREKADNNLISNIRRLHYENVLLSLKRFLIIEKKGNDIVPSDFTTHMLLKFRKYMREEYLYIIKYPQLFIDEKRAPKGMRSDNTVASRMQTLSAFFADLKMQKIIKESPFDNINKGTRKDIFKRKYDEPISLTISELKKIQDTDVPEDLKETRDIFVLNCLIGCRIGELQVMTRDNIHIDNGIAFVAYLPQKTAHIDSTNNAVIKTPLMETALKILIDYDFSFKLLKNISGKDGYNKKLKALLKECGLDREVFLTECGKAIAKPLYDMASTKLARKTHIEGMQQVQIDRYAAGLHSKNSNAVDHYGKAMALLKNKYILMCAAFDEQPYMVDNELNFIS